MPKRSVFGRKPPVAAAAADATRAFFTPRQVDDKTISLIEARLAQPPHQPANEESVMADYARRMKKRKPRGGY